MKYLNGIRNKVLIIHTKDGINIIKWYVDASFAVHPDFKSHAGASMFFGKNAEVIQIYQGSRNLTQTAAR